MHQHANKLLGFAFLENRAQEYKCSSCITDFAHWSIFLQNSLLTKAAGDELHVSYVNESHCRRGKMPVMNAAEQWRRQVSHLWEIRLLTAPKVWCTHRQSALCVRALMGVRSPHGNTKFSYPPVFVHQIKWHNVIGLCFGFSGFYSFFSLCVSASLHLSAEPLDQNIGFECFPVIWLELASATVWDGNCT